MPVQHGLLTWRRMLRRSFIIPLSLLVLAVIVLGLILHPFAEAEGPSIPTSRYQLDGLHSSITISYDTTGMPHIAASNEADGYAGLCWSEAHDRLFQLDELRRAAEGRLAEIFGAGPNNTVLGQDELFRTFGLVGIAQAKYAAADTTVQSDMSACARGINAFITFAEAHQSLPPEFADLGYSPEQWQPWQSELIATYFAASLDSSIYLAKLERAAIIGLAGPQVADALVPDPPDSPSMFDATGRLNPLNQFLATSQAVTPFVAIPANAGSEQESSIKLGTALHTIASFQSNWAIALLGGDRASNNFALDGTLTASGKPLLANDPHLQLATPSLLYLAQLTVSGRSGFNFEGLTIPGSLLFVSGHNGSIAFGATFVNMDDTDLYSESIRETAAGEQALYQGQWVPMQEQQETIQVAGASPVTLTVRTTPHGPILNDALPSLDALGQLALKAAVDQSGWTIDGFFSLPKAQNWSQFRTALSQESIGLNFLFADTASTYGHIGYQMAGLAPQRSMDNTLVPVAGGDGTHEWSGYAAFSQLPSVYNPPSHLLETSNDRIVPSTYAPGGTPIYISRYFDLPWRSERAITLLLRAGNHLTATDLAHIQLDTQTTVGKTITADLTAALNRIGLPANDPDAASSLAALQSWDGNAGATSSGAAIYETLVAVLDRDLVTQVLGDGSYPTYTQNVFVTTQIQSVEALLASPSAPFFGAISAAQAPAARDQAVQTALAETDELLQSTLGANESAWSWGAIHTLTYNHPLAAADARFTIGSFPVGGDSETLDTGGWFMELGLLALPPDQFSQAGGMQAVFQQDAIATARVVWDMGDFDHSLGVVSTGESGNPASPHWSDQAALWRAGQYNLLPYSHAAVDQGSETIMLTA